jgi:transposase
MPAQRKYPDELRERAVKMVLEIRQREGKGHGELARVGRQLGVHPEALRGVHSRVARDRASGQCGEWR